MGIFGFERRQAFPEPFIPPFPGAAMPGQSRSDDPMVALQVPTVWACVNKVANTVSMLELETFRDAASGVPPRVPSPDLLLSPSAGVTLSEWLHTLVVSLLLRGNGYGLIQSFDNDLRPRQIQLVDPDKVRYRVDADGADVYTVAGRDFPANRIWHVPGLQMPGSRVGLSPISYAAATIGVDLGARRFAAEFFDGGGVPKAVLNSDQNVTQEQARTIKERLLAATRTREPIVLGAGLSYTQISVSPEESQFLLTQQANVAEIARFFGVPASMVGGNDGGSMTYANAEQRTIDFLTFAVAHWLKRIEDRISLLLPPGEYVRFNVAALLRVDAATQATVDNMQLAGKTRVPSEFRERDGLPPFSPAQQTEADMVPLTITPTGGAKALPALKEPPGPPAPVPAAEVPARSVVVHNYVAPSPAPDVHMHVDAAPSPDVRVDVAGPTVNVAPAAVTVEAAKAPNVILPSVPRRSVRTVERDASGEILRIVEE